MSYKKDSAVVLLERSIVDSKTTVSRIQVGKAIVVVKSVFDGDKSLSDLLFDVVYQKESA